MFAGWQHRPVASYNRFHFETSSLLSACTSPMCSIAIDVNSNEPLPIHVEHCVHAGVFQSPSQPKKRLSLAHSSERLGLAAARPALCAAASGAAERHCALGLCAPRALRRAARPRAARAIGRLVRLSVLRSLRRWLTVA